MNNILLRFGILGEFVRFLWKRKLYWLLPLMVMLSVVALLVILGSNPATQPFIYSLW